MKHTPSPRRGALAILLALVCLPIASAQESLPIAEVWKSPICSCCGDWIAHLHAEGFTVRRHDVGNTQVREHLGMPQHYGSCHTAQVGGYVIEGHVPAEQIKRLLAEKPKATGLSVPDMPIGSPGMDGPAYRGHVDPYQVLLIQSNGSARVFATYEKESPQ